VIFRLDGLSIRHKLAVLCSAFLLPIGFLTYLFITQTEKDIAFARKEAEGATYFRALGRELAAVIALSHGTGSFDAVARAQSAVAALDAEYAARMDAMAAAEKATAELEGLSTLTPQSPPEAYDPAIDAVLDHISRVQDGSNLTLDPDIDSYYAQDLVTVKLPALVVAASRALDAALPMAAADRAGPEGAARLLTRKGELTAAISGADNDVAAGLRGNADGTMKPALLAPHREFVARAIRYLTVLAALVSPTTARGPDDSPLHPAHDALQQAADALWTAGLDELDHLLRARIDGLNRRMGLSLALTVAVFAASVGLAWQVAGSISRPLGRLHHTMHALALGNTAVAVPDTEREDEVGVMAKDVEIFKQDGIKLAGLVEQVIGSARQVALTAGQVGGAIRQSTEAITEVSRSTQGAHALSATIAEQVGESRDNMQSMAEVVRGTAEHARRVELMAESISRIAEQTHMLALNAAIEAARAGEHSAGFAVVAEEVRKLAEHSGELAQQIGLVVRSASEESRRAVSMVESVTGKMEAITQNVRRNDILTARVAASMEEQQATVTQINHSIDGLTQIAQSNASAAEEISSAIGRARPDKAASTRTGRTAAQSLGRLG
jgi:methyl-accepting chemotaxis protein